MWAASASQWWLRGSPYYDFSLKPLFHALLYLNYTVARALDVHPMLTARAFFAGNAILCVLLVFRILRARGLPPALVTLAVLTLIGNSFFIKRFAQVRSDLLVTTLLLLLFDFTTRPFWETRKAWERVLLALALSGLGVAITPKSLPLFALWCALFLYRDFRGPRGRRVFIGIGAFFLGAAILNWRALVILLNSFPERLMGAGYFEPVRLIHLVRWWIENPPLIALLGLTIWALPRRHRWQEWEERTLWFACAVLVFILVYPDRLPFFLASLLPFLVLPCAFLLQKISTPPWLRRSVIAFSLFNLVFWGAFLFLRHDYRPQARRSAWAMKTFGENPALTIYDPVGVIPLSAAQNWFVGPAEKGNAFALENFLRNRVDVLLYADKMAILEPRLSQILREQYWPDGAGLFFRAPRIPSRIVADAQLKPGELRDWLKTEFQRFFDHPDVPLYFVVRSPE
ncbi:MAG TPA: hypothetical protein PKC28_15100, partial [Bdellovibrionales bacterium]|nr:hypothetical protein [Bdellovibrionales bacterium]